MNLDQNVLEVYKKSTLGLKWEIKFNSKKDLYDCLAEFSEWQIVWGQVQLFENLISASGFS